MLANKFKYSIIHYIENTAAVDKSLVRAVCYCCQGSSSTAKRCKVMQNHDSVLHT